MIVKLPFPDAALFPNRRLGKYWGATVDAKAQARDGAFYLAKAAVGAYKAPAMGNIPVSIVFVPPSGHHRDLDGCLSAAKHALDGVAMALGIDDSRFRPVLIDMADAEKPGAMIVAVGVEIRSGVNLND